MNERVLRLILILTMVVNGALAVASLRRIEGMVAKWEAAPGAAGPVLPAGRQPSGVVSHVYPNTVISSAWANDLVDHVNDLDKRCPRAP